jgi:hypothetical protein
MSIHTCPGYEAALMASAIEHSLLGMLSMETAHEAPEDVLHCVWRDGISRLMLPPEQERFLALSPEAQRGYFASPSVFCFEHFRDHFLASARRKEGIVLQ